MSSVEDWAKTIAETISVSVQKLELSGFKYVINTMLVQKTDGGVQVTLSIYVTFNNLLFRPLPLAFGTAKMTDKFKFDGKINS